MSAKKVRAPKAPRWDIFAPSLSRNYISRIMYIVALIYVECFLRRMSVVQAELFRHFTEVDHNEFLEDVIIQITDRVFGESRLREGFWQFKLNSFMPEGLNVRFADHYLLPLGLLT